jgi:lipopolysaccharide/colanic/teichoic acid biosynthesis glycosyltransferase
LGCLPGLCSAFRNRRSCRWSNYRTRNLAPPALLNTWQLPHAEARSAARSGSIARQRAQDLILLILMTPLILVLGVVIAIAVFLDSPGPIFYRSVRVGRGGKPFGMLKFRKMRNEARGPMVTAFNDQRLTPIGRFLQASRLDELPQFWHVLRGQMSIVGPRPEVPEFVSLYEKEYEEILDVMPGLTGLVQVQFIEESRILATLEDCDCEEACHCAYEKLMPRKVQLDLTYVRHRRLTTDLAILARTLVLPFTVAAHRVFDFCSRQARAHLLGWSFAALGVLLLVAAFAAQAGSIR